MLGPGQGTSHTAILAWLCDSCIIIKRGSARRPAIASQACNTPLVSTRRAGLSSQPAQPDVQAGMTPDCRTRRSGGPRLSAFRQRALHAPETGSAWIAVNASDRGRGGGWRPRRRRRRSLFGPSFLEPRPSPDGDEQFTALGSGSDAAAGHPHLFVSFDIGGDKPAMPYGRTKRIPFLGCRGVRLHAPPRDARRAAAGVAPGRGRGARGIGTGSWRRWSPPRRGRRGSGHASRRHRDRFEAGRPAPGRSPSV